MTSGRPTIYVHIGPPKTATTYIQDIVWGNRIALAHQGVHLVGTKASAHFQAAMDIRQKKFGGYADPKTPGSWQRLAAAAMRVDSGKALISHEIFAGCSKSEVRQMASDLEGAELHIVFTARDLGRQLPAVWQESLKNRSTTAWEEFLEGALDRDRATNRRHPFWKVHDTADVLARWAAVVPPHQIHVLTAPPSGSRSPDLWSRFAGVMGIETALLDMSVARRNTSLSRSQAEVLRLVNQELPPEIDWPTYQHKVKRRFNYVANNQLQGERIRIPESYRGAVIAISSRISAALTDGGYDLIGDVDDVQVLDAAFGPDESLPASEVAEAAAGLLARVLTAPVMRGRKAVVETPSATRRGKLRGVLAGVRQRVERLLPAR